MLHPLSPIPPQYKRYAHTLEYRHELYRSCLQEGKTPDEAFMYDVLIVLWCPLVALALAVVNGTA